ncbi:MAG TPA: TRAP transporter fused permease subunit [Oceanithermus profundus]|uniref:TRAP transporter fused permease subunit n=1 Tax=Oceanithermus profundus TaxID=187137 RepID=A0A7C4Z593_9DEIN|nr:TRAP transporter fused permease subunit [Oceanithermus profundus]
MNESANPKSWLGSVLAVVALLLVAFQVYTAGYAPMTAIFQRSIHLTFILVLLFLSTPVSRRWPPALRWLVDGALVAASLAMGGYLYHNYEDIIDRFGWWEPSDVYLGIVAIVLVLEATRRAIGWPMTIIAALFIGYAYAGPHMPGVLAHKGYGTDRLVGQLYLTTEGIFGVPLGVAATFVFIFILFGSLLEATGAGKFFIDLAYALAGKSRGGPAKASVVASAFMGSLSGSAIANVVTTGAFTIPLMKKLGYKPEEAAGVEAAASTGGQIMPPIMGAGAFLIAEYTQTPYLTVVKLSIVPAILYFLTVYLFVDLIAAKRGMRGLPASELPPVRKVLVEGWHYLIPLFILVYYLFKGVSAMKVGFIGVLAIVLASNLRPRPGRPGGRLAHLALHLAAMGYLLYIGFQPSHGFALWQFYLVVGMVFASSLSPYSPLNLPRLLQGLVSGATAAIPVSVATAAAGIVVGVVGLTGVGLKFSHLVVSASGGHLFAALVLVALASLVLGMGLPVTASYIVLVVLAGPALQDLGVALIIAHLIVFWYSQDSNVTPPVALAAYAASGLAGTDAMRAGVQAWKFAKGLYLIPLLMVYAPGIMFAGSPGEIVFDLVRGLLGLWAFAAALEGHMFRTARPYERLLLGASGVALFWPLFEVNLAGFALLVLAVALGRRKA